MTDIARSLGTFRLLDDLSRGRSRVHGLHPLAKLVATAAFLVAVASTSRRELVSLLPFALYPILVASLADLPPGPLAVRILGALPFIAGIGILNPLFDRTPVAVAGLLVGGGWLTFLSLLIKGGLTIAAALVLIATTGIGGVGEAMRALRVPRVVVLQLLLTYRYLALLLEELGRMLRAHDLRSPKGRGIGKAARGAFPGQLLVRAYGRAQRVYDAMLLRGFDGEYRAGPRRGPGAIDAVYAASWSAYFLLVRFVDLPGLLGALVLRTVCP